MSRHIFLFLSLSLAVFIIACQEDETYVENDPRIRMYIYNMDSLKKEGGVNDTLSSVEDSLEIIGDSLDYYSAISNELADLITEINDGLEEEDDSLIAVRDSLIEIREIVKDIYTDFEELDALMQVNKVFWDDVSENITSGNILVNAITNRTNGQSIVYTDSSEVWYLPLDMNATESFIDLEIGDSIYDIDISYSLFTEDNEFGEVLRTAYGFDQDNVHSDQLDSLKLNCNSEECLEYETSISLYF